MIDKSVYTNGTPLPQPPQSVEDILFAIEGESPDMPTDGSNIVMNDDGTAEVTLEPQSDEDKLKSLPFDANLAEHLDDQVLSTLATDLMEYIDADLMSRKEWVQMLVKGLEVLGIKIEERTTPWKGACGIYSPLLNEAAIRFQSEMITEAFPAAGPVKTQVIGEETPENKEAATRVQDDMNFMLTDTMVEYRPEHERMLYALGLSGAAFKKVYKDPMLGRAAAMYIAAEDLIMPYGASSVYTSERVTLILRKTKNEFARMKQDGFYKDVDLGEPTHAADEIEDKKAEEEGYTLNNDERYHFYECHAYMDVPGLEEDIPLPYVITIDKGTNKVLGLRRNWEENDKKKIKAQHFVQYTYVPGFGAYGMGFIHIIGGYALAGTSLIRQLVDAGTLSNLPGGLKTKGMRIKGDDTPIAPGEWRDVDVPAGTLRDNLLPMPYKEPSQTLLALLNQLTDEGRKLGSIADLNVSDMSAQAPVGTTLALLERQLKLMGAVQARVHASQKQEFKLLKKIIRDDSPDVYEYTPVHGTPQAKRSDYDRTDVIPVSDPNAATMAQRIMQYQAAFQMAQGAPQIYNLPYLHRQMLEVLGVKNAEKLVPIDEDQKPRDPISENMAFLVGKPTQAFIFQDHEAHIATHMAMMQDPMIMQMMGQSPMAQQMMGAVMAHIAQHVAFRYRSQIEEQLGVPLNPPDADMDPQVEVQLSRVVAQAAQQLLQSNTQKAQQQQAQQQAQNPEFMLKQQELQLKAKDSERKDQDSQRDYEVAQEKLRIEKMRLASDTHQKANKTAIDAQLGVQKIKAQERQHDKNLRADVVKTVHATANRPAPGAKK